MAVLLAATVARAATGAGGAGEVALTVVVETATATAPANLKGRLVARRSAHTGSADTTEVERELTSRGATLSLSAGTWEVAASAPGYWCATATVTLPADEPTLTLRLWPTGRLAGRLATSAAPANLTLRFAAAPGADTRGRLRSRDPAGEVACALSGARWSCEVPAGVLDLELRAKTFVPIYLWDVRVPTQPEVDLGVQALRPGASVAGFVEGPDASPAERDCRVQLRLQDGRVLEGGPAAVTVSARGFFQIAGILPADYLVDARGKAGRAVLPIRVLAGTESRLAAPLSLHPPLSLRAVIAPPVDPWGAAWRVRLGGAALPRSAAIPEPASNDGVWRRDDLVPGRYVLIVESAHDGSRWYGEEVDVGPDSDVVRVDLSLLNVRGRVTLGGEPLPNARLAFGGERGLQSVVLESDAEGRFEGALPHAGQWSVGVRAEEPVVVRTLAVEVDAAQEVEISLPDTTIVGTVVDESGQPQPAAMVTARSLDHAGEPPVQAATKADGSFRLSGLAAGQQLVLAQAMTSPSESDEVVVTAREAHPVEVSLVVRTQVKVDLKVVAGDVGVPGAEVKLAPAQSQLGLARVLRADAGGALRLSLPAGSRAVRLSAGTLGYAYRMLQAPLPATGPLVLALERAAGTLVLEWPPQTGDYVLTVSHAGAFDDINYLTRWALANGGTRSEGASVIPQLEPGAYTACMGQGPSLAAVSQGATPSGGCVSGVLGAGAELRLSLPESARQAR